MKRLYEMTVHELRAEAEAATARGDERRAAECRESIELNYRIAEAFQRRCSADNGPAELGKP
jgi:hypothetical protein